MALWIRSHHVNDQITAGGHKGEDIKEDIKGEDIKGSLPKLSAAMQICLADVRLHRFNDQDAAMSDVPGQAPAHNLTS